MAGYWVAARSRIDVKVFRTLSFASRSYLGALPRIHKEESCFSGLRAYPDNFYDGDLCKYCGFQFWRKALNMLMGEEVVASALYGPYGGEDW